MSFTFCLTAVEPQTVVQLATPCILGDNLSVLVMHNPPPVFSGDHRPQNMKR